MCDEGASSLFPYVHLFRHIELIFGTRRGGDDTRAFYHLFSAEGNDCANQPSSDFISPEAVIEAVLASSNTIDHPRQFREYVYSGEETENLPGHLHLTIRSVPHDFLDKATERPELLYEEAMKWYPNHNLPPSDSTTPTKIFPAQHQSRSGSSRIIFSTQSNVPKNSKGPHLKQE